MEWVAIQDRSQNEHILKLNFVGGICTWFSMGKKKTLKEPESFYGENVDLWFINDRIKKPMYKWPFIIDSKIKSRKEYEPAQ